MKVEATLQPVQDRAEAAEARATKAEVDLSQEVARWEANLLEAQQEATTTRDELAQIEERMKAQMVEAANQWAEKLCIAERRATQAEANAKARISIMAEREKVALEDQARAEAYVEEAKDACLSAVTTLTKDYAQALAELTTTKATLSPYLAASEDLAVYELDVRHSNQ